MSPKEVLTQHELRLGEVAFNKFGSKMKIIEYNDSTNIIVEFENGYTVKATYQGFIKGGLTSPYDITVYGHGYLGEGKYKYSDKNKKRTKQYMHWQEMLRRCYDSELHKRAPTYIGCSVTPEWFNFQVFGKWYDENIYNVGNMKQKEMNLDKDILAKGNKIYSPSTCVFTPKRINGLFVRGNLGRGIWPIGVYLEEKGNRFRACCSNVINGNRKRVKLGSFKTPEEAFAVYKTYKENLIKKVAEHYIRHIPKNLYDAMINYKVEITD